MHKQKCSVINKIKELYFARVSETKATFERRAIQLRKFANKSIVLFQMENDGNDGEKKIICKKERIETELTT